METAVYATIVIFVVLLGAALLVVWSRRDIPLIRALAAPAAIVAASAAAFTVGNTLGFAVPYIAGITAPTGEAPLISAKLAPNKGIYITLDLPGEPKLFWLPWDKEMAQRIQDLLEGGGAMVTTPPYEWSWDTNPPTFNEMPQPKWLPEKDVDAKPKAPHFSA